MKFTLYKPNPKNTGSAFSFDLTKDKKEKRRSLCLDDSTA